MKRLTTILSFFLLGCALNSHAQIFWVENFESGSTGGLGVASYTGPNGAWSSASTGGGSFANEWYVSCAERGYVTGTCGDGCSGPTGLGATLHVGSNSSFGGDNGASYLASALSATNVAAQSPVINCSGHTGIMLSFYYIENGEAADDDGSVYYSPDGGTTWSLLLNTAKTTVCASGQGQWGHASVALPASANNNPSVRIAFAWVNDADNNGTDPSYAVDSVALSTSSTSSGVTASFTSTATTICEDSCIDFTNTSTGTIDSFRWVVSGVLVPSASSPLHMCFANAGSYTMTLRVYGGTSSDSSSAAITVNPAPHPLVTSSGTTLTSTGTSATYQWYKNDTAIAGATNATYDYGGAYGSYYVIVDSGGCKGMSNIIVHTVGVAQVSVNGTHYSIAQSGTDVFTLYATQPLTADMNVQVFDATGRQIMREQWLAGTTTSQYHITGLASGIYMVRIGNADNAAVLKWLKQ